MPVRSSFQRAAFWIASPAILLPSDVLGAPVVVAVVLTQFPAVETVVEVCYAPLIFYGQQPELPGSQHFAAYADDVQGRVMEALEERPPARTAPAIPSSSMQKD
jgi:hypothetical protein